MENNENNTISFEGATLQEAYEKASIEFNCSITDLKSEVIQAPSNGFFGLFKKNAIIEVCKILTKKKINNNSKKDIDVKDISSQFNELHSDNIKDEPIQESNKKTDEKIFDDFYSKNKENENIIKPIIKKEDDEISKEIQEHIKKLFKNLCYDIELVNVSYWDSNTIYVEFNGEDSALLIGKEGYRYNALSYILFNWIHSKYNLMLRLEISKFLVHQEESILKYLEPVIETIKKDGFYKTKPLDGILIHIALTKLRDEFPQKYVAIKTNIKGDKYILVNEYKKN